jgi:hypothetical protein
MSIERAEGFFGLQVDEKHYWASPVAQNAPTVRADADRLAEVSFERADRSTGFEIPEDSSAIRVAQGAATIIAQASAGDLSRMFVKRTK